MNKFQCKVCLQYANSREEADECAQADEYYERKDRQARDEEWTGETE